MWRRYVRSSVRAGLQHAMDDHVDKSHAWHAVMRASEMLSALKDALFAVEELRLEHAGIWDAATGASPGRLLLALDDARDRLVKARDDVEDAARMPPAREESTQLLAERASLHSEMMRARAEANALEMELETDRALLGLYDVCLQCERHMHSLESAIERDGIESESVQAKKQHTVPACQRLLTSLQCMSVRRELPVEARIERIHARWKALIGKCGGIGDADVDATAASLEATLSLSPPGGKRRAVVQDDARKRRWSLGTPSRLPRTPASKARTPSTSQRVRSMHKWHDDAPSLASPTVDGPRWTSTLTSSVEVTSPSIDSPRAGSVLERRPSSSQGRRLRRRESLLPRLARDATVSDVPAVPPIPASYAPSQVSDRSHSRLRVQPSTPVLSAHAERTPTGRTTPSASGRTTPSRYFASSTPGRHATAQRYIPDVKDPLDIAMARLCNPRGIALERMDDTVVRREGDLIHRYTILSKTVACRVLRMVCIKVFRTHRAAPA